MLIVDKETLEVCNAEDLRREYPHILFDFTDPEIVGEVLNDIGKAVLHMPDQPVFDARFYSAQPANVAVNNNMYSAEWELTPIEMTEEDNLALRAASIAEKRYEVETAGIYMEGPVPTDRHTQQVLTTMYLRASTDPNYTINFKTAAGFIVLTSDQIITIANAVHDHVQAAFNRERELLLRLENGEQVSGEDW